MTAQTATSQLPRQTALQTDELLRKYATQLTTVLAFVVCVTGIMMFFRWHKGEVEAMHEWLGVGFVVAAVLHATRHRKALFLMLTQTRTRLLLVITALLAAAFLVYSPPKTASPVKQTVSAVLRAPLGDIAPIFDLSADQAVSRLAEAGIKNTSATKSIEALARSNKKAPIELLKVVIDQSDKD
ncbi:MAG: DUF4405 domain-containing protein [Betaproteobacteria bacterium]